MALLCVSALALLTYALIEAGGVGGGGLVVAGTAVAGAVAAVAFVVVGRRRSEPMMPPDIFSSRQFTAVNLVTLCVYAALGAGTALLPTAALVAPLTATVLGSVDVARAGLASGIDNAAARAAGPVGSAARRNEVPLLRDGRRPSGTTAR